MNDPTCLLKAIGLVKRYGSRTILSDASFSLAEGDVAVLLGANGSGKTTFLDILSGHAVFDSGLLQICSGGKWIAIPPDHRGPRSLMRREMPLFVAKLGVRRTWQDCRLFPTLRLWENIAIAYSPQTGESIWRLAVQPAKAWRDEKAIRAQSYALLHEMKLQERSNGFGSELSLGQEKRLAIRRVVEAGGRILLLDEPMSGLDEAGRELVIDVIRTFLADGRSAVVIAEHASALTPLLSVATKILELQDGVLRELDEKQRTTASRSDPLPPQLSADALSAFEHVKQSLPGGATLIKLRNHGSIDQRPGLTIRNVTVYRGKRCVLGLGSEEVSLHGISFELALGEMGILLAPNGWGKTTLLDAIAGLMPVQTGTIAIGNLPIDGTAPWSRKRHGLRLLRARDLLFDSLTPAETMELMGRQGMTKLAGLPTTTVGLFSGGEHRKLGLATLSRNTDLVTLVDEPFSGLDKSAISEAWSILGPRHDTATLIAIPTGSISYGGTF